MSNASQTLQTDLYNIASKHDGILDMLVYGFVNDLSPSQVREYQDMLNTNFPNQVTKVTTEDDNPVRALNFRGAN